eukprot:Blabericola_migrator_1__7@NODE_1002_length_5735_cov_135_311574_g142_i2_p1_GENE_NODE_1002_length_5735_cov_135_311574_g142_i2NODE_1002_length_5735_cov_135_311574_g142_i2_p1_ORF_typecomplete_len1455_score207_12FUSC/PF04632_12/80FUSC/PF04632_12/1_1e04FUSC/PF04632_12/9e02FUSC/PF04632_12/6_2e13FUSC_2/PF13515_6/0_55FUSC_2/PF13515_6/6_5e03FUSC_2/PF13515_6/3_5e12ALMT/PF11744_8/2e03ALMT/PF11744_8/5e02ALMT/PF11744_8/4_3e11ArAE_1/PF06081_11/10ArAE_1/PF06081_11/8_8e03ArAE_1/PF06081_11/0_0037_NODE_1002_length
MLGSSVLERFHPLEDEEGADGEKRNPQGWSIKTQWRARTERAARMICLLPLAIWIAYEDKMEISFAYLIPITYVLYAALMPATLSGVWSAVIVALPFVIIGAGIAVLIFFWAISAPSDWEYWQVELVSVAIFFVVMIILAPFRLSPNGTYMTACLSVCVSIVYQVQRLHRTMLEGLLMTAPVPNGEPHNDSAISQTLFGFLTRIQADGTCLWQSATTTSPVICHVPMPDGVLGAEPAMQALRGHDVVLTFDGSNRWTAFVSIDRWFYQVYTHATGHYGFFRTFLLANVIGTAILLAIYLVPPFRHARTFLRDAMTEAMCKIKNSTMVLAEDLALIDEEDISDTPLRLVKNPQGPETTDLVRSKTKWLRWKSSKTVAVDIASAITARRKAMFLLSDLASLEHSILGPFGIRPRTQHVSKLQDSLESMAVQRTLLAWFMNSPRALVLTKGKALTPESPRLSVHSSPRRVLRDSNESTAARGNVAYLRAAGLDDVNQNTLNAITIESLLLQQALENAMAMRPSQLTCSAQTRLNRHQHRLLSHHASKLITLHEQLITRHDIQIPMPGQAFAAGFFLTSYCSTFILSPTEAAATTTQVLYGNRVWSCVKFARSLLMLLGPLWVSIKCLIEPYGRFISRCLISPPYPKYSLLASGSDNIEGLDDNALFSSSATPFSAWSPIPMAVAHTREFESLKGKRQLRHNFRLFVALRFIMTATLCFALILMVNDNWGNIHFSGDAKAPATALLPLAFLAQLPEGDATLEADVFLKTPLGGWTFLGFVTCFNLSWQSTLKRALNRGAGTCLACFNVWLCHLATQNNGVYEVLWLCVTIFMACWIYVNPRSPLLTAHPSWGYTGQVFSYTSVLMVVQAHMHVAGWNEIILDRLIGHFVGIGIAVLAAFLIFPVDVGRASRFTLADTLYPSSTCLATICHIGLAPSSVLFNFEQLSKNKDIMAVSFRATGETTTEVPDAELLAPKSAGFQSWLKYFRFNFKQWQRHEKHFDDLDRENSILHDVLPCLRTPAHLQLLANRLRRLRFLRQQALNRVVAAAEHERDIVLNSSGALVSLHTALTDLTDHTVLSYVDFESKTHQQVFKPEPQHGAAYSRKTRGEPEFLPLAFTPCRGPVVPISPTGSERQRRSSPHPSARSVPRVTPLKPVSTESSGGLGGVTPIKTLSKTPIDTPTDTPHTTPPHTSVTTSMPTETPRTEIGTQTSFLIQRIPPAIVSGSSMRSGGLEGLLRGESGKSNRSQGARHTVSFVPVKSVTSSSTTSASPRLSRQATLDESDLVEPDDFCDSLEVSDVVHVLQALRRVVILMEVVLQRRRHTRTGSYTWTQMFTHRPERVLRYAEEFESWSCEILDWCENRISIVGDSIMFNIKTLNSLVKGTKGKRVTLRLGHSGLLLSDHAGLTSNGPGGRIINQHRFNLKLAGYWRAFWVLHFLQTECLVYREMVHMLSKTSF